MYGARVQREMMLERAPLPLQDTTVYAVNEVAWRSLAAKGVGATGQPSLQSTSRPSDGAARTRGSHPAPGFPAFRTGRAPSLCRGKAPPLLVTDERSAPASSKVMAKQAPRTPSLTDH